jgi:hypothetical protein
MKNILIVGGLHGDEPTGITIANYFIKHKLKGIKGLIGNSKAIEQNKRYIETDLNRSFIKGTLKSLEEKRALGIRKLLWKYHIVLDFHNTKAEDTTCAIVTQYPLPFHLNIAKFFGFRRIIIMPASGSLIACTPKTSLSLEIAENDITSYSVNDLISKIKQLQKIDIIDHSNKEISIYRYLQHITKEIALEHGIIPESIYNFQEISDNLKIKLKIDISKKVVPIFAKKIFNEKGAFTLVEKNS